MVFTSEENEVLNQAAEILARHVVNGTIDRKAFDIFAGMIESISASPAPQRPRTISQASVSYEEKRVSTIKCDDDQDLLSAVIDNFSDPELVIKYLRTHYKERSVDE